MTTTTTTTHWTNDSTDDFLYRIAADFVQQLENYMESRGMTQTQLAEKLSVTPGRVSQVLNNPGNLTLETVVQYARALGKKVAVVAYDDRDESNVNGPVNSQVFVRCWERAGRPADFFAIEDADSYVLYKIGAQVPIQFTPSELKANTSNRSFGATQSAGTDADNAGPRICPTVGVANG